MKGLSRPAWCSSCDSQQPVVMLGNLVVCSRCRRQIPTVPQSLWQRERQLERDCPVCGAPAGERCVMFDPRWKGRRSTSRLRVPHEVR